MPADTISLPGDTEPREVARQWSKIARHHATPKAMHSVLQLVTTVIPLVALWTAMMLAVEHAYWLTLLLSVLAAAFTVRLFVIQHDCGHRSFFRSRRLNDGLGAVLGVITLTPHEYWRRAHNAHHAGCGDLEKRGIGDIDVLTVDEYTALPAWKRLIYRFYRNPAMILGIGPIYLFVVKYRLPLDLIRRRPALLRNVMGTNLGIAAVFAALGWGFGFANVLMVQAPIVLLSSTAGVWLFYVQHQFEFTYWKANDAWDFHEASVMASSFYDLPQPLRWFTGNIGIHHLHHLSCRIPNYRLADCLADIPALQTLNRISLCESLSCLRLALWDEAAEHLVSFGSLRRAQRATA